MRIRAKAELPSKTTPFNIISTIFLRSILNPKILRNITLSEKVQQTDKELNIDFLHAQENQMKFEESIAKNANILASKFGFDIRTAYRDKNEQQVRVTSKLFPAKKIDQVFSKKEAEKIKKEYKREFVREGSYMQFPEDGWINVFYVNSSKKKKNKKQIGFFFIGGSESSAKEYAQKFKNNDLPVDFKDIPEDLRRILGTFLSQVNKKIDICAIGDDVVRPMRFCVYPENQGNGYLKLLLALLSLSTSLLNFQKEEVLELIEARAGIAEEGFQGSKSVKDDHQLTALYLLKRCFPVIYKNNVLLGINNPYYNLVIARDVPVKRLLSKVRSLPASISQKFNNN